MILEQPQGLILLKSFEVFALMFAEQFIFYTQCKDARSQENHMIPFTVHLSVAYVSPPFRNVILMASAKYIRSILSSPWPQRLLEI